MTSASARVDKRRRTYVRLIGEIHHALNQALSEEKAKRKLNKTEIGKILGVGRSAISKKFDGRHNLTLETLADLAYALDRPVKVTLPERIGVAGTNHHMPSPRRHIAGPVLASMKDATVPREMQNSTMEPAAAADRKFRFGSIASIQATGSIVNAQRPGPTPTEQGWNGGRS